ncbi:hypothetical protein FPQ18DRAFT_415749 [Pyronema domesticum]|nr:hypothetical protein FPQ18DRAFT_415749 [Pyronema domesticum]
MVEESEYQHIVSSILGAWPRDEYGRPLEKREDAIGKRDTSTLYWGLWEFIGLFKSSGSKDAGKAITNIVRVQEQGPGKPLGGTTRVTVGVNGGDKGIAVVMGSGDGVVVGVGSGATGKAVVVGTGGKAVTVAVDSDTDSEVIQGAAVPVGTITEKTSAASSVGISRGYVASLSVAVFCFVIHERSFGNFVRAVGLFLCFAFVVRIVDEEDEWEVDGDGKL